MHNWNNDSDTIDWKGINEAAEFIGTNLVKWGRMGVRDWKEKYGTVRVYVDFGWHQIHSVTHPRHCYSRYPNWLWRLDCNYGHQIMRLFNWAVVPYHAWLYTYVYGRALERWPHLRSEILQGADYNELLQKYGVHRIRTSNNCYDIRYDWHPDNYYVKYPPVEKKKEGEDE